MPDQPNQRNRRRPPTSRAADPARSAALEVLKLVATGGGTSAVKLIEDGQLDATAGVPSTWLGYQAIDAIARTLAGQPVPDVPVVSGLLVKDNVADQAATGTYDGGFDYAAAY